MGCNDTVLPEPFLENHNVICFVFERTTIQPCNDNLCLFRALALSLQGNVNLEEKISKLFNLFLSNGGEGVPSNFRSIDMNDIPKVEDLL